MFEFGLKNSLGKRQIGTMMIIILETRERHDLSA